MPSPSQPKPVNWTEPVEPRHYHLIPCSRVLFCQPDEPGYLLIHRRNRCGDWFPTVHDALKSVHESPSPGTIRILDRHGLPIVTERILAWRDRPENIGRHQHGDIRPLGLTYTRD